MTMQRFSLTSAADGLTLAAYHWPCTAPRALLVLSHGLGEHSARYGEFALALNGAGIDVYSLDHRGHGASPGPSGLGDFGSAGWDGLVADVGQLIALARSRHPSLPCVLFGHSMGSFAAQQVLFDHSAVLAGVVLSGSAALDQLLEWRMSASADGKSGLKGFNADFEPARTDYDWLSRDAAQVDKYIADPLCGFDLQPASGLTMAMAAANLADANHIAKIRRDLPMLLLAGTVDPVTGKLEFLRTLEMRYRTAGIQHIDTLSYADGRHEMLNETNRQQVYTDVCRWLERIVDRDQ